MTDLRTEPYWKPEHVGRPLPDETHATSVCLPTWQDNIDYEEREPALVARLQAGYPRFVFHPLVQQLHQRLAADHAGKGESLLSFLSVPAAERAAAYIASRTGSDIRVAPSSHGLATVIFGNDAASTAKSYWQHCGEGVCSRRAESLIANEPEPNADDARAEIATRLAQGHGIATDDVRLDPSGMAAIFAAHRLLAERAPGRPTVQFGFPYVDALKVQQQFGTVHFLSRGDADDIARLEELASTTELAGLFCEFPSNPLLIPPDLPRLATCCRRHGIPLVVDDTVATSVNADVTPHADLISTSLTKAFSGVGNVMGGALLLNPRSPLAPAFRAGFEQVADTELPAEDALVLATNSRDYVERVRRLNRGAMVVAEYLRQHPAVDQLFFPYWSGRDLYDLCRKPDGGYGFLYSLVLKDPAERTPRFYNALRVSKGPSLGAVFSLACPYTLLAHYHELDAVEACGVSRWLVRVSVGEEEPGELVARFAEAFEA